MVDYQILPSFYLNKLLVYSQTLILPLIHDGAGVTLPLVLYFSLSKPVFDTLFPLVIEVNAFNSNFSIIVFYLDH